MSTCSDAPNAVFVDGVEVWELLLGRLEAV